MANIVPLDPLSSEPLQVPSAVGAAAERVIHIHHYHHVVKEAKEEKTETTLDKVQKAAGYILIALGFLLLATTAYLSIGYATGFLSVSLGLIELTGVASLISLTSGVSFARLKKNKGMDNKAVIAGSMVGSALTAALPLSGKP
ncbi:MAG: hypothetical protein KGJ02_07235 [Verrucomicrobiota bacterium]|nr:hypothetical protein [Verrucomicrobiota bacterium]